MMCFLCSETDIGCELMRILHICLANFYFEGLGYQENILPSYHKKAGHEVVIFTSDHIFDSKNYKCDNNQYINESGVLVKAIKKKNKGYFSKFRDYVNLYHEIELIAPDIIFVHGGQFIALKDVIKYTKNKGNIKLYIDQHADYYNSPVNTIKKRIAAKVLFGFSIRRAVRYTEKFWGVTPWRCQYLNEIYGVPKEKIDLLTMGGDDDKINFEHREAIRQQFRKELNLAENDFVIITGGKIDKAKNIHLLMQAVKNINNENVKLVVFGKALENMKDEVYSLTKDPHIIYIEWLPADKVYDYFLMSDLAIFPGTHSVLWEQACACGLPGVFKDWVGMRHVNVNGNCEFLYKDSVEEIESEINKIYTDKDYYDKMKNAAENCKKEFFYSEISKKSIS